MDDTRKLCQLSNLEKPCDNFPKVDVISQYHQDIKRESLGFNDSGNLIPIIKKILTPKKDLFTQVCECVHGYTIEDMPTYVLDCYGAMMGISREICNESTIEDNEAYRILIKNRIEELANNYMSLGELTEHLKGVFGDNFRICQNIDCIRIFMDRELTAVERENIQVYLDSLPIPQDKCVKLYEFGYSKCFTWDNNLRDPFKSGWDDLSDWECDDSHNVVHTRKNKTDASEQVENCFYWDAPYIKNTVYGFHSSDENGKIMVGFDAGANWADNDCNKKKFPECGKYDIARYDIDTYCIDPCAISTIIIPECAIYGTHKFDIDKYCNI